MDLALATRGYSLPPFVTLCTILAVACGGPGQTPEDVGAGGAQTTTSDRGTAGTAGTGAAGTAGTLGAAGTAGTLGAAGAAGAAGRFGTAGADAHGDADAPEISKKRIGNRVFDDGLVQSYYLTLSEEEYAKLMDLSTILLDPYTVNENRYVQASLRVGDTELPTIGVRFKGNYSIWGCVDSGTGQRVKRVEPFFGDIDVCQRFSLKLDFNRYDDHLRLDGLKKLNLHAMAADPSKMRERLGYSLFRDMDVVAPRAAHARVYLNGEYQGLFAVVEQVDGRFTTNRFPESGDGNLYRDLWPTEDLVADDAESALKTNDDPAALDVSDFLAFRDAIVASTDSDFATKMAPHVDFDYLARYIVVDRAISNSDGVMAFYFGPGWGPSNANYYWYDVGDGRFTLIPWDFDKVLWYPEPNFWADNAANGLNVVPNWNVVTNSCDGYECFFDAVLTRYGVERRGSYYLREIDCDPFLRRLRAQIYDRQKGITEAFIAGPFSEESVKAKVNAWRTQIEDAIKDDPLVEHEAWKNSVDALLADLPKFQNNVRLMMSGLITK